jgi:small-conductance mechanosensitive channel
MWRYLTEGTYHKAMYNEGRPDTGAKSENEQHKLWLKWYIILGIASIALYVLCLYGAFDFLNGYTRQVKRLSLTSFFIFCILMVSRYTQLYSDKHTHSKAIHYNLSRLINILSLLAVVLVVISFLFENWYTAAVSLGLFSLILGFALQTPISSFIGWLYILIRNPYKVGDRIQLGTFKGDVVEIGYLDTTLWEFAGEDIANDLPSGRLIRFPNTMVLQAEVYNYSWRKFPYIWNEISVHVAYQSDLEFVETTLRAVAKEILEPGTDEIVKALKLMVHQTPIDGSVLREYPYVTFRAHINTWVECSVKYLVDPRSAATVGNEVLKMAIMRFLEEPERVMLPRSNAR